MLRLPCLGVRVGFYFIRVRVTVREYVFVLFGRHAIILLRFGYDCLYRLIIVTHHNNVDRSRPLIRFRVYNSFGLGLVFIVIGVNCSTAY